MRTQTILVILLALVAVSLLVIPATRAQDASDRLAAADRAFHDAVRLEQDLHTLRAATPAWLGRRRPTADVAALLLAVLKNSGLAPETLIDVSPQDASASRVDPATGVRWGEQGISVRLGALSLPDLGLFLDHWRAEHPEWSVASIDMLAHVHQQGPDPPRHAAFTSTIRLVATFVE